MTTYFFQTAKVKEDPSLANRRFIITEESMIWTVDDFTAAGQNIPSLLTNNPSSPTTLPQYTFYINSPSVYLNGDVSTNEDDYVPYCYPETTDRIVIETGQQISVLASNANAATEYEQGRYKFTNLPAGTFAVKFEDGGSKISHLIASPANLISNDDTIDSDGIATYSSDKSKLQKTVILGIELPAADDVNVAFYESKYHDSGFYERGYELPGTGGIGTHPYTMGGILLIAGAALLLLYRYNN